MILKYYGHSFFTLTLENGSVIAFDPYGTFYEYPRRQLRHLAHLRHGLALNRRRVEQQQAAQRIGGMQRFIVRQSRRPVRQLVQPFAPALRRPVQPPQARGRVRFAAQTQRFQRREGRIQTLRPARQVAHPQSVMIHAQAHEAGRARRAPDRLIDRALRGRQINHRPGG